MYKLLKLNNYFKNHRIKFVGLFILHVFKRRYITVNIDPIMACNLRCKMCYFSDKEAVKKFKGVFKKEDIEKIASNIFYRAYRLQIGCGTEPTLYNDLTELAKLGKENKVPFISLTTNANLLTKNKIEELLCAGINEFIISLHGVKKKTYENFMEKGSYKKFIEVLGILGHFKSSYNFKIRVNYTFNKDNFLELNDFFDYLDGNAIDIIQLRPLRKLGDTKYQNFDLSSIKNNYEDILEKMKIECNKLNITLLAPRNIEASQASNLNSLILKYVYYYISPQNFRSVKFNLENENFEQFSKRNNIPMKYLHFALKSQKSLKTHKDHLNYDIF